VLERKAVRFTAVCKSLAKAKRTSSFRPFVRLGQRCHIPHQGGTVSAPRGQQAAVRIRINDHKVEPIANLKNFSTNGRYVGSLALTPDDSILLLRDTGTQDIYSVDWEAP